MYQFTNLHLEDDSTIRAEMASPQYSPEANRAYLKVSTDQISTTFFGTIDQILNLARSVEQAARAWQMERDGVGKEDQAKVFDYQNDRVSLT